MKNAHHCLWDAPEDKNSEQRVQQVNLLETFENKIETIMSEIDSTQTARAREKFFLLYFDLQGTIFKK